ncbi:MULTISPECIES: DUF7144 family membrane protein [unclassified Streptomyces]|uniref:DUF7144 family membrane protein n=1 Tax=unclassified Streptomyces TaxID=2593676 RepID=UPI0008983EA1|nr:MULTISPECIES: hypothetical protein [unclassified Streptomyces]PKW07428.1 hypothetical protein BX260_2591 [Streptomyces sp. 5112.2]SEC88600.1 hypothetical protein SAMN05216532_2697 [Streptomyces sp. 2231.1]SEC89148.1 hypothetical protein SAMN05428944_5505 [Streptomyces sp. 1222.5]
MTTTHTTEARKQHWASGLMLFGAVMLMVAGVIDIFRGIMGIAEDDVFIAANGYVFRFDLTGWGWVTLILGAVAVVVSMGLFQTAKWARISGIVIAGLIIIANFLSLPYSPIWSTLMIAFAGVVIWALCVVQPATTTPPREAPRTP